MNSLARITPLVCLLALLGAVVFLCVPDSPANEPADATTAANSPDAAAEEIPLAAEGVAFVGARSCSSTACHGAVQPPRGGVNHNGNQFAIPNSADILRNEFLVWLEEDPHSGAAATLASERSKKILRNLGAEYDPRKPNPAFQREMKNCVACHSPQTAPSTIAESDIRELTVGHGVSCESCHGAAVGWLDEHYSRRWATYNAKTKSKFGLIDTANLLRRAAACSKCHVGAPNMEVNHDLIAAGHPPLKFEFTAYLDLLPKHWNEAKERKAIPEFESRSWLAGQIACVQAALRLLEWRSDPAQQSAADGPSWPEFAEYDCFGCHHDLQAPSWRIKEAPGGQKLGRLSWGSWYFTLVEQMGGHDTDYVTELRSLRDLMEQGASFANKIKVNEKARTVQAELSNWLMAGGSDGFGDALADNSSDGPWQREKAKVLQSLLTWINNENGKGTVRNWDVAVQVYLLLTALNQAEQDLTNASDPLRTTPDQQQIALLRDVRDKLQYPDGYDSPKSFSQEIETEPMTLQPTREFLRLRILELHQRLAK